MQFNQARAFSLIELIITVSIIALLMAVAAPTYQRYVDSMQAQKVIDLFPDLQHRYQLLADGFEPAPNITNPLPEISSIQFSDGTGVFISLVPKSSGGFRFLGNTTAEIRLLATKDPATQTVSWSCTFNDFSGDPAVTLSIIRNVFPDCTCPVGVC